jgi:uncharacterized membrane protein
MASQKQERSTTGQQGSGRQSGSGAKAAQPKGGSPAAGASGSGGSSPGGVANRTDGRTTPSGSGRSARPGQSGNGRSGQSGSGRPGQSGGRPGQPTGGQAGRGGRPGAPASTGRDRPRAGQPRAATLAPPDGPVPRPPAPRWLQITTLILSLAGLGDSIYLTIAHYTSSAVLACPANSFINCGEVTTSSQSIVFGIFPVAVLGLAFYVFLVAINSPWAWRADSAPIRGLRLGGRPVTIHWIRVASLIAGMGFVLYLLYAELIQIGKICEYCTLVHIITFALFVVIMFDAAFRTGTSGAAARR